MLLEFFSYMKNVTIPEPTVKKKKKRMRKGCAVRFFLMLCENICVGNEWIVQ